MTITKKIAFVFAIIGYIAVFAVGIPHFASKLYGKLTKPIADKIFEAFDIQTI